MESSIVEEKLTDGSSVFAVQFVDGSNVVQINCCDEEDAKELQDTLELNAVDGFVFEK